MNKRLHRVVFNAARGLRMAVHEGVRSAGKATGATPGLAVAAFLLLSPAQAQIAADRAAPGNLRPTVLAAPNGVPLVNIQTPSAAGVSRNIYSQFDVQSRGAILNNSRSEVQTQLGGWVQGNPWLARGPGARDPQRDHQRPARRSCAARGSRRPARRGGHRQPGGHLGRWRRLHQCEPRHADHRQRRSSMRIGGLDSYVVRGGTVSIEGAGLDVEEHRLRGASSPGPCRSTPASGPTSSRWWPGPTRSVPTTARSPRPQAAAPSPPSRSTSRTSGACTPARSC